MIRGWHIAGVCLFSTSATRKNLTLDGFLQMQITKTTMPILMLVFFVSCDSIDKPKDNYTINGDEIRFDVKSRGVFTVLTSDARKVGSIQYEGNGRISNQPFANSKMVSDYSTSGVLLLKLKNVNNILYKPYYYIDAIIESDTGKRAMRLDDYQFIHLRLFVFAICQYTLILSLILFILRSHQEANDIGWRLIEINSNSATNTINIGDIAKGDELNQSKYLPLIKKLDLQILKNAE